jgi:hypothetical protein
MRNVATEKMFAATSDFAGFTELDRIVKTGSYFEPLLYFSKTMFFSS